MSAWFGRPFSWAILLFALGMTVLLSPVATSVPREGQLCAADGGCFRLCGSTLTQSLAAPGREASELDRASASDCTATARARLGYGVLLLLAAAPAAVAGLVRTLREAPDDHRAATRTPTPTPTSSTRTSSTPTD